MKHHSLLACLLIITAVLVACNKHGLTHADDFYKSYIAFSDFKRSSHDSYRYTVTGGSWVGYGWQTTITVTGGKVTQRSYSFTPTPGRSYTPKQWTENENEIGTHRDGDEAVTLDVIYGKAETEWLRKRDGASVYFETKNNGMISTAGYVMNGCQDDCFVGIYISKIEAL